MNPILSLCDLALSISSRAALKKAEADLGHNQPGQTFHVCGTAYRKVSEALESTAKRASTFANANGIDYFKADQIIQNLVEACNAMMAEHLENDNFRSTYGDYACARSSGLKEKAIKKAMRPVRRLGEVLQVEVCHPPVTNNLEECDLKQDQPDEYGELREFARNTLKGQEREVLEALCENRGEMPITDLAIREGIDWKDAFQGFKDVQSRLNPKLKKHNLRLKRQNNAAKLQCIKSRKRS